MSRIKLELIQEDEVCIDINVNLSKDGRTGYSSRLNLYNKDGAGWAAHMNFDGMPPQATPEEAVERLGLYLISMSKAMKGKNIKHLGIGTLFDAFHK